MESCKKILGISMAAVCIAFTLASVQARADDGHDWGDRGQYARPGEGDGPAWNRPDGEDRPQWRPEREDDQPRWRREQEDDDNSEGSFGLTIGPIFSPPIRVYSPPPPPAPHYWYYCAPAQAYYPNVQSCPIGWQLVPAR